MTLNKKQGDLHKSDHIMCGNLSVLAAAPGISHKVQRRKELD
jgi:hypothetical protein